MPEAAVAVVLTLKLFIRVAQLAELPEQMAVTVVTE